MLNLHHRLRGALPGESLAERDRRILGMFRDEPALTIKAVMAKTGAPYRLVRRLKGVAGEGEAEVRTVFVPRQMFTPAAPLPATPQLRLASMPPDERASIAARYGVVFREAHRA